AEAERQLGERRSSLGRDEREALTGDLERLRGWFEDEFERNGAGGVAVFAARLDDVWQPLPLFEPVGDAARIDRELYLTPLVRLVDRPEGALVAYIGRERADLYRLRGGRLVEIADQTTKVPGRHDQGGWSQARFGRHIEAIVARHLSEVAAALDASVRRLPGMPVVLIGPDEIRPELESIFAGETRSSVAGWATAEAHADPGQLLEAALPLLAEWRSRRDEAVLERWQAEAATGGRASADWEETLEAASDGRVELLLVHEGVDRAAYRCPACGRAQAGAGPCPLDGAALESCGTGLDLAVHQTLNHGGVVRVVADRSDLASVGGIGALLRF
ncbi:MAG TPA: Vms1/Ankzf1 family peptidyl-tRNA hydrolase, partial [Gaiellaceae bacterium]|nr:Vms1/Ankzf1 family peptidyl-tRNA hydrolase [Gaiellaceae bacterium]